MNKDKVYLKGYVVGHAADTLGYKGLMVQLENLDIVEIDKNLVHKDINEPQLIKLKDADKVRQELNKPVVKQFVADWIKYCKNTNVTMTRALLVGEVDFYNYANQKDLSRLTDFFSDGKNQEIFARAWLDGYTVEKEKRYYVRFKGMESDDFNYLNFIKFQHAWVLSSIKLDKKFRTEHTKKQLEEAGFGWVFDCPGIEVEEVEE